MLYPNELVITDGNYKRHVEPHADRAKGLIPRDYAKCPLGTYPGEVGMHDVPDLVAFSPSDFPAMIKELEDSKTRLSDFRMVGGPGGGMVPSRDQNGKGYCWAHSGVSAQLLVRARDDMPYVDLSAYAVACQIKNFVDEGGWGAQGLDWDMKNGVPSSEFWPQQSMSRSNVNDAMKANALLHRFTEGWIDLGADQYDRKIAFNQEITSYLCRVPVIKDENWWSHSICGCDAVNGATQFGKTRFGNGKLMKGGHFDKHWGMNHQVTGGIGVRIWNSWGDSWSAQGMGVLTGSQAVSDGATAPRVATWSAK